jgi:tRNA(Ile)-lysidine synthase
MTTDRPLSTPSDPPDDLTRATDEPAGARACAEVGAALKALLASGAVPSSGPILLALSGGLDSTVLLHAAVRTLGAARCCAVHIHHGLSPSADAWQAHCAQLAGVLGCAYVTRRVQLAGPAGTSVEANARDARYAALAQVYREQGAQALLLGQHADDQAETVLLQLLRGAGLPGLAAMAAESGDPYGMVRLRPLLGLKRATLAIYARHYALSWVEDESNLDTRYARNALRHELTPVLERHFPSFRVALARAARHAAQAQSVLEEMAELDMRTLALGPLAAPLPLGAVAPAAPAASPSAPVAAALSQEGFAALSLPRAANLLRYWMKVLGLPAAPAARLDAALQQIRAARPGTAVRIDHARACLRVYRGSIAWEAPPQERPEPVAAPPQSYPAVYLAPLEGAAPAVAWPGAPVWHLPAWHGSFVFKPVARPAADGMATASAVTAAASALPAAASAVPAAWLTALGVTARPRTGGELMRTAPARSRRTLKKLFQERGVPAWRRDVPLLFAGETLLWVPQLGLNHEIFTQAEAQGLSPGDGEWWQIDWVPDLLLA